MQAARVSLRQRPRANAGQNSVRWLACDGKLKPFCDSAEFGGGVDIHFTHYLTTMDLRSNFTDSKSRGDLLRQHPGQQQSHHFSFASSQRLISFLQLANLVILLPSLVLPHQRPLNRIKQILIPKTTIVVPSSAI